MQKGLNLSQSLFCGTICGEKGTLLLFYCYYYYYYYYYYYLENFKDCGTKFNNDLGMTVLSSKFVYLKKIS